MKILLKGYYGFGNFGDDILLKVSHGIIRKKHAHASIFVYSNYNQNLHSFSQYPAYNHYIFKILNEDVRLIDWTHTEHFDLVIDGGGGVYFDANNGSMLRKSLNHILKFIGSARVSYLDKLIRTLLGKKKRLSYNRRIAFGVGIGPYTKSSTLLYHHMVDIGSTDVMLVRDKTSQAWLDDFKFAGYQSISADIAFFSEHWLKSNFRISEQRVFQGRIGIILLDWPQDSEKLFSVFQGFANQLLEKGNRVTFFSFDVNYDKKYIAAFKDAFDFVAWQPDQMTVDDFLAQLSGMDLIFSARAHGAIIGAVLGVPAVCIGTSKKLIEVSKMFPSLSSIIHEPITQEGLLEKFHQISKNYESSLRSLQKDVQSNKALAADTLSKLLAQI